MSQIDIRSIVKTYKLEEATVQAVQEVSLNIEKGDFVSIIGHSGSGKTTLLSIMGGILEPSSGEMVFNGTNIYSLTDDDLSEYRAKNIGYVFQFASLLPVLTAKENLMLPSLFMPGDGGSNNVEKKAIEYLELVGLKDKVNAYPSQLSGGQQRRVAIVRALMNDPELLLADEPTGDLDEETEADVMEFFKKINTEKGITFVLVTHSIELAKDATRKLRMTHGKVEDIS